MQAAVPPEPNAAALPVLDVGVLAALVGPEPDILQEFLGDYARAAGPQVRRLHDAIAAGDLRAVCAITHKLKSSSRSVGALQFAELCSRLEQLGKVGNQEDIALSITSLDDAWEMLSSKLSEHSGHGY
jgi:HPt (histidine-containing phosphotransfer) domain-containing protein